MQLDWLRQPAQDTADGARRTATAYGAQNHKMPPPSARRLLRSVLFTPASQPARMRKALLSKADAVVLDLEDAVAPHDKDAARAHVVALLHDLASTTVPRSVPTVCVRINCVSSTRWGGHDLQALAPLTHFDALLLPKVEDATRVQAALDLLERHQPFDLSVAPRALWCMVETARGVQRVDTIADLDGVAALIFGSNDLTKDLKARHTASREPLLYAMSQVVCAARAAGKQAVDGVHLDIADAEGIARACRQGRDLGFDGKSLIHPSHIDPANAGFGPAPEEVAHARKVIAAYEGQGKAGPGVIAVDGQMVEALHVEQAKLLVAEAEEIARLEQSRI